MGTWGRWPGGIDHFMAHLMDLHLQGALTEGRLGLRNISRRQLKTNGSSMGAFHAPRPAGRSVDPTSAQG